MASYNHVILLGNLTRDPQLRYLPNNQMPVADFGIAVNRRFKTQSGEDREEVTFVDCTAWSKQAELINQYFRKGKLIFISGRLKLDTWEDKQGGGKRSKLSVVVEDFQFVGDRAGGGGPGAGAPAEGGQPAPQEGYDQRPQRPAPRPQQAPPPAQPPIGDEQHFKEDDIPF